MKPEEHLHLLAPYLPTDRFRALLRNGNIPTTSQGAALLVDISGFTPMTTRLVAEFGPRASEELKRRINPMFEAIAGQVFHHGGSVIRFLGDGFTAWFDDNHIAQEAGPEPPAGVPGVLRALAAGLEMQGVMRLFRGLHLKVCVGMGTASRWVVGQPTYGLADILSGPAVEAAVSLSGETQPGQTMVNQAAVPLLRGERVTMELTDTGNAVVTALPDGVAHAARRHRWPAWAPEGNIHEILDAVRSYVDSAVRQRVENGFGAYVGELRNALPMFIQLGLSASSAAETLPALDAYVRNVQDVLSYAGGRLMSVEVSDKGSVLFVVFGAPVAYGDDAERALRVALTLKEASAGIRGIEWQRIGISRGLLYAGTVGGEVRHEYSTIGDETNIAARLMTAAEDGQILVSSAVRKEAGPRIIFRELAPVSVKGRASPIPIFEPTAILTGISRQMHTGRFIGREDELTQLSKQLGALRLGHPRVVRIVGEAGIGKSRLVSELSNIAGAQGFRVATGDCISTGRSTAYLPWQQVLTVLLRLNPEAGSAANIGLLSGSVEKLVEDSLPRLPLLGDVLQLPIPDTPATAKLEGQTRQQAIVAFVTELLLRLAGQQPLALIIEDIQWIDEISQTLAVDLIRRLTVDPAPLMLVLTHRPLLDSDPAILLAQMADSVHFHRPIHLGELGESEVTMLIEKHLEASVPPELSKFVYERAQGNPFFVQEVIDALQETRYIATGGARVVIVRSLQGADMPHTIQDLIQARIDRLSEMEKLMLKVAAVIGREFQARVLAASIPVPIEHDALLKHLQMLEARDLLYLAATEPDLVYRFRHALTQEVIYQSLLFAQRRDLHHAVATTLEIQAPDAIEQLAYHFSASGDRDRARQYAVRAGQRAFREYANQAALEYFTQALALARDDDEWFTINCQRIPVMLRLSDMQGVRAELPAMQAIATASERLDWQAAVHSFWADYHTQTSAWPDALREAQQAAALAEAIGNDALAWDAYLMLRGAMLSLNQRHLVVRSDLDQKMQAIAERMGDQHHAIALILTWFDDLYAEGPDIAIQGAQTALARAEELQAPVLEAQCWSVLTDFHTRDCNLPAALEAARNQIRLLRQIGDRRQEGLTLNRIGNLLINLGQLTAGSAHLLDAYQILSQIGERSGLATNLTYHGFIAEAHGAYDEALAYLDRALLAQRELNAEIDAAVTLFHKGNVLLARRAPDEAECALVEAREILEANRRLSYALSAAEIDAALAMADIERGRADEARARLTPLILRLQRRQINGLSRLGLAYWRAVHVLHQHGEHEQAAQLRRTFRVVIRPTLEWLEQQGWKQTFITNLRYHADLLAQDGTTAQDGP